MNKEETYKRYGATFELQCAASSLQADLTLTPCNCSTVMCQYASMETCCAYAGYLLAHGVMSAPDTFLPEGLQ